MRVPTLPITLALIHLLAPISVLATPLPTTPPPLLLSRSQFCTNAPTTKVGTLLTRHPSLSPFDPHPPPSPPALHPRKSTSTILWCAPSSKTYIILSIIQSIPGSFISTMLDTIIDVIQLHINRIGDAVLGVYPINPTTVFQWIGERGLVLKVANSNNHQATWGVLGAALTALQDYMRSQDAWGTAEFTIFDGKYEVGKGTLK